MNAYMSQSFNQQIGNVGTTEFSQGRTMRWGIGWSFDPSVNFPVSGEVLMSHVHSLVRCRVPTPMEISLFLCQ